MKNMFIRMYLYFSLISFGVSTQSQTSNQENAGSKVFSRPEERGEDLSNLVATDAVSRFARSADVIERRKLAKVIGDKSIAGNLQLSDAEKLQIQQQVASILQQAKSPDANERSEARQQIERLWHAAVPALILNITPDDVTVAELAVKSLILMRNESIVNNLIREATTTTDAGRRQMLIFALSKMTEQRKSLIPGRE